MNISFALNNGCERRMEKVMKIYPSLISSNLLNIQATLKLLDNYCDGYHLDIMDDHFVPNLTWGPAFINAIGQATEKPLHVHLMVENPERWLNRLNLTSNDCFIFHIETVKGAYTLLSVIHQLSSKKIKIGIALNPKTEISVIANHLDKVDHVLIMSVEPGFSGQAFISNAMNKIAELKKLRSAQNLSFTIALDGGINGNNITSLAQAGVDLVCVASAIFTSHDPVQALKNLYQKTA